MTSKLIICLLTLFSINGYAQDYYPLNKGNNWTYKLTLDSVVYDYIWETTDSSFENGVSYFKSQIGVPGLFEDSTFTFNKKTNENIILTTDSIGNTSSEILFLHDPTNDSIIINGTDTVDIKYYGQLTVAAGTFQDVYTSVDRRDSLTTLFFAPDVGYIRQDSDGETILELKSYHVNVVTSSNQLQNLVFNIYPNPASEIIHITEFENFELMTIHDLSGKEILKQSVTPQLDLRNFKKGVYFLSLTNSNITKSSKFIVR